MPGVQHSTARRVYALQLPVLRPAAGPAEVPGAVPPLSRQPARRGAQPRPFVSHRAGAPGRAARQPWLRRPGSPGFRRAASRDPGITECRAPVCR